MTKQATEIVTDFLAAQDETGGRLAVELCADGFAARVAGFPRMDVEGFQAFVAAFYGGFPDLSHDIQDVVADDDRVVVRLRVTGTHDGRFLEHEPTGRAIEIGSIAIFVIRSGKVTELWVELDQVGLLQQIGALPSPESVGA